MASISSAPTPDNSQPTALSQHFALLSGSLSRPYSTPQFKAHRSNIFNESVEQVRRSYGSLKFDFYLNQYFAIINSFHPTFCPFCPATLSVRVLLLLLDCRFLESIPAKDATRRIFTSRLTAMNDADAVSSLPEAPRFPERTSDHVTKPFSSTLTAKSDGGASSSPEEGAINDDFASVKADSEAETIIQSGREELSPEKRRTHIQHIPERELERETMRNDKISPIPNSMENWQSKKRKRPGNDHLDFRFASPKADGSRPPSPGLKLKRERTEDAILLSVPRAPSLPRDECVMDINTTEKSKKVGEGDEDRRDVRTTYNDQHKRQHILSPTEDEVERISNVRHTHRGSHHKSRSPIFRSQKRGFAEPLNSLHHSQKKRKAPPHLVTVHRRQSSEARLSPSYSSEGSPPPTTRRRRLTSSESHPFSPIRQMQHKKLRDQNGRTRLARACAAQEVEAAKARQLERPGDLNIPDNAGNTPLQIAALEGCAEIVKFLLEVGCDINTKNIDKDTPLIDAVENGHLEVVKLLLDAGANPRVGNAKGDQPFDLIPSDNENRDELRRVIAEAKARGIKRRKSEDIAGQAPCSSKDPRSRGASATSSRDSPPAQSSRSPPPPQASTIGRRRTGRSEATRNDLLWTKPTFENLQAFAAKGDMAGVATILNILQKADTESLIAAAKGGHDDVLGLLLGIGDPDPDPEPLKNGNHRPGYNTPMLAAIGKGNLDVVRLLLNQQGFDPTRTDYRGRPYYKIAQERKGDTWEAEHDILREAYDKHVGKFPNHRRVESGSPRRSREKEKLKASKERESVSPVSIPRKKHTRSPVSHRQPDEPSKDVKIKKELRKTDGPSHLKERPHSKAIARDEHDAERTSRRNSSAHDYKKGRPLNDSLDQNNSSQGQGEEPVKRRRLIAGRPPPDYAKRKSSLISSDSLSSREDGSRVGTEESDRRTLLKRARSSLSPKPSKPRNDPDESREIAKKRRLHVEPDSMKSRTDNESQPSKPKLHRRESHPSKIDRVKSHTRLTGTESAAVNTRDSPVTDIRRKSDPGGLANICKVIDSKPNVSKETEEKRNTTEAEREALEKARLRAAKEKELEFARIASENAAQMAQKKAEEEERKREELKQEERRQEESRKREEERKEEEERKRKEAEQRRIRQAEEERQRRLEQERLRQARIRREQEEQEQRRRDALPIRLCTAANLIASNDSRAKTHDWLKTFMPLMTASSSDIDSNSSSETMDERWVPNFFIAPLLASNDFQLSQYPSWEKRNTTLTQRNNIWRVSRSMLSASEDLNPLTATIEDFSRRILELRPKFFQMEHIFWVKLSDFMDLVPHIPHLHGLDIQIKRMHIDPEPAQINLPPESTSEWNHDSQQPTNSTAGASPPMVNGPIHTNGVHIGL
ncbi:Set3 complex subunit [Myotisia sp. PD_48]|nr:Set3 complex subunit [Myotisia sp. PD_48]